MAIQYIDYNARYFTKACALIWSSITILNSEDYSPATIKIMKDWQTPQRLIQKFTSGRYFLAIDNDQVVAIGGLVNNEVCTMFTHPGYIKQGIASRILSKIELTARQTEIKKIVLSSTLTAKEFYLKSGFKIIQQTIHQLDGKDFAVYEMEKILS